MLYSYFVSCLSDSLYLINNLQTGSYCNGQSHQRYCVWYCSEKCFYCNTDNKRACFEGLDVDLNKEFSATYSYIPGLAVSILAASSTGAVISSRSKFSFLRLLTHSYFVS